VQNQNIEVCDVLIRGLHHMFSTLSFLFSILMKMGQGKKRWLFHVSFVAIQVINQN
jgi:hypothetical protein